MLERFMAKPTRIKTSTRTQKLAMKQAIAAVLTATVATQHCGRRLGETAVTDDYESISNDFKKMKTIEMSPELTARHSPVDIAAGTSGYTYNH